MAKKKRTTKKKKIDVSYGVDKVEDAPNQELKAEDEVSKEEVPAEVEQEAQAEKAPKKTLIDEINEMKAAGEVDTSEFREKMGKLENVLGVDTINPFGTNEMDIFEDKLKGMTTSDLQNLAYKVGINPYLADGALKNNLKNEFKAYNRNNMRNIMPSASKAIRLDPNDPQHAKTIKILGEI